MATRTLNSKVTDPSLAALSPSSSIMTVDPTTATRWLAADAELAQEWADAGYTKKNNRRIRFRQVNKFADDMTNGRWILTGAPIQFSTTGRLLDGRHRLTAIVESGATVRMFVTQGLPDDSQLYMDLGAKRTLTDQLLITGASKPAILAAGARLALAWTTDRLSDRIESISDAEVREFIASHPSIAEYAEFADTIKIRLSKAAICACAWQFTEAGHSQERVQDFFTALGDMNTGGAGDPKYALLNRINRARTNRERLKITAVISLIVRVFNADTAGETINRIHAVTAGATVKIPAITPPVAVAK